MNKQRIMLGGLLAGVIIAAGQYALSVVAAVTEEVWKDAFFGSMPAAIVVLRSLTLGVCCVLLYLGLRPQLGAGPRAAVTAGLAMFIFGVAFPPVGATLHGPPGPVLIAIAGQAVVIPLATLAGAWLYRDRAAAPVTSVQTA